MGPRPIGTPDPVVDITYESNGERRAKRFTNAREARRFYIAKFKAGKNPTVKRVGK